MWRGEFCSHCILIAVQVFSEMPKPTEYQNKAEWIKTSTGQKKFY